MMGPLLRATCFVLLVATSLHKGLFLDQTSPAPKQRCLGSLIVPTHCQNSDAARTFVTWGAVSVVSKLVGRAA